MHRSPVFAGTLATLFSLLFVMTLAVGFGVEMTQAVSQALPIVLAAGLVIALSIEIFRRELA